MTPIEKLEQLIDERGTKKSFLARRLGITPQGLNSMFRRRKIPDAHAWTLGEFYGVDPKEFSDTASHANEVTA